VTDEIHQLYVWGRTSDILDVTADAVGGLVFIVTFIVYQKSKLGMESIDLQEPKV